MKLSEEELKTIVDQATANLKLQLTQNLTARLDADVTSTASHAVKRHVEEWVRDNILPDVTAILIAGKTSLVNTAAAAAEAMCEQLSQSMVDCVKEKLSKSWDRKKIFEAMFT